MESLEDTENPKKYLINEEENEKKDTWTLNEPIKATITRDLFLIFSKIQFFFLKEKNSQFCEHEIQNYELSGPFIFTLLFSVANTIHTENKEDVFSLMILFLIFGFFVLTINTKLLKIRLSYLQGFSIFGYLMCPLSIVATFNSFFHFLPIYIKWSLTFFGFAFSIRSCFYLFKSFVNEDKVFLVTFPIFVFYACLCWFVLFS